MATTVERIAAGSAALDRHFGTRENWTRLVDFGPTYSQEGKKCIINQLFGGNYQAGLAAVGARLRKDSDTVRTGVDFGFSRRSKTENSAQLTQAWRDYLGITSPATAAAASPAAFNAKAEARRIRDEAQSDAVFSGLVDMLDQHEDGTNDYDYVLDLAAARRDNVIAAQIEKLGTAADQNAVLDEIAAIDKRNAILS